RRRGRPGGQSGRAVRCRSGRPPPVGTAPSAGSGPTVRLACVHPSWHQPRSEEYCPDWAGGNEGKCKKPVPAYRPGRAVSNGWGVAFRGAKGEALRLAAGDPGPEGPPFHGQIDPGRLVKSGMPNVMRQPAGRVQFGFGEDRRGVAHRPTGFPTAGVSAGRVVDEWGRGPIVRV